MGEFFERWRPALDISESNRFPHLENMFDIHLGKIYRTVLSKPANPNILITYEGELKSITAEFDMEGFTVTVLQLENLLKYTNSPGRAVEYLESRWIASRLEPGSVADFGIFTDFGLVTDLDEFDKARSDIKAHVHRPNYGPVRNAFFEER